MPVTKQKCYPIDCDVWLQGFGTGRTRVIVERWRTIVKCMETSTSVALLHKFSV
jgi:hypothetical protein